MAKLPCDEASFRRDIAEHTMKIIRDDGVYRHIRFRKPGTSCYLFDLITWPGYLCYTGDMGTYVFQRTHDMFEFFRTDRIDRMDPNDPDKLYINVGYWTEKLVAVDGSRGGGKVKNFDETKFKAVINAYRVRWMRAAHEAGGLDKEERRELWEAVDDEVLRYMEDGEDCVQQAAYDFSWAVSPNTFNYQFDDLFEHDFTEYTHSIIWCLYALAWGIKTYDTFKASLPPKDQYGRDMKCSCCGTTENLHEDRGSGGPYRCSSPDCMVF